MITKEGKKGLKKDDYEWYNERLPIFLENGTKLKDINPSIVEEYNEHSLKKLICISYWIGIFTPIAHNNIKKKYGTKIAYVDLMAGSGVTSASDYFLSGSCPSAILSADSKNLPFDLIIAVEKNNKKAKVLENRLKSLDTTSEIKIFPKDISDVSDNIAEILSKNTISYVVIDPHGFRGISWKTIKPLIKLWGDVMLTWFEHDLWRVKTAAETKNVHKAKQSEIEKLNELFGDESWKNCNTKEELTDLFIQRIIKECNKKYYEKIKITRESGQNYFLILFSKSNLVKEWKKNVERRINSFSGNNLSNLLRVHSGKNLSLDNFN